MLQELTALNLQPCHAGITIPSLFADAGEDVSQRFAEFFTVEHRNANTRAAYAQAVRRFTAWADGHGFRLLQLTPVHVAGYVEQLGRDIAAPTVKQHLAAIRTLFGTEQKNSANFEREDSATGIVGSGLERGARTKTAVHRAVVFAWSGRTTWMWHEALNT